MSGKFSMEESVAGWICMGILMIKRMLKIEGGSDGEDINVLEIARLNRAFGLTLDIHDGRIMDIDIEGVA